MNSSQLRRWLSRRGCTFETKRGTGHLTVRKGSRKSQLPVHGGNKQLGTGLISKILRDLGIDDRPPR
ncbi:MAG: type II toxin-antitoxin system HicA family toxin [Dehalococcoidia bacterium]|nr:type II toxin-antitoxin system HicA family toxin [Dehalococcoidia bacterium]